MKKYLILINLFFVFFFVGCNVQLPNDDPSNLVEQIKGSLEIYKGDGTPAKPGYPNFSEDTGYFIFTLEENGHVRFPDAPTERGIKHINGLMDAVQNGYKAAVFFVIQMENVISFSPNYTTHPQFGDALKQAQTAGVHILAYSCKVTPDTLEIDKPVPVIL